MRVVCRVDAGVGGAFRQSLLPPLAEAALFDDDRQPAARRRLQREVRAPGETFVICRQAHLAPGEMRAGIGAVQTDHDASGRRGVRPGDDMNRDIARRCRAQIEGSAPEAARERRRLAGQFLRDRAWRAVAGEGGELGARVALPVADIRVCRGAMGELRPNALQLGPMALARAEAKPARGARIGIDRPAEQRHRTVPGRQDPSLPFRPSRTRVNWLRHADEEYREAGAIDSVNAVALTAAFGNEHAAG
jgi:hypothetical protein